tara:strand:- start:306 stop:1151 length:846 start_codon:yes stop_codon:yes gene_type:complete
MSWFKRKNKNVNTIEKKSIPDGLWVKCPNCDEILFRNEMKKNLMVCHHCQYHFRLLPEDYLKIIFDNTNYEEINSQIRPSDPLNFKAVKKYKDQIKEAVLKTGSPDVLSTYIGEINKYKVVLGVMNFKFIGGSMGSVVGEKISKAVDYAQDKSIPLILISASGGARMQEGVFSLMQLAKVSAKIARFSSNGGLFISLLTDPTTGGVSASYGMQGDFILAEPGALICFAGPRVIKQTIGEDLPDGFQKSEFLLQKGFLDAIVHRKEMKKTLLRLIKFSSKTI